MLATVVSGALLALVIGEGNSLADWILTVAACITAMGVIVVFLNRAGRAIMRIGQAVDVVLETPSWQKQMNDRVTAIESRIGIVEHSAADAVEDLKVAKAAHDLPKASDRG